MGTFATRRQVFEKDSTDHVLVGLKGEADLKRDEALEGIVGVQARRR